MIFTQIKEGWIRKGCVYLSVGPQDGLRDDEGAFFSGLLDLKAVEHS